MVETVSETCDGKETHCIVMGEDSGLFAFEEVEMRASDFLDMHGPEYAEEEYSIITDNKNIYVDTRIYQYSPRLKLLKKKDFTAEHGFRILDAGQRITVYPTKDKFFHVNGCELKNVSGVPHWLIDILEELQ